jgi:Asp-tRNA(Asn)/Glu-tRNA(Gln) amidotransferase A subunit family amidase
MTEPCDLTAVAARRLIGARKLSPVELLDSCLARIGAVNHAVNAMVALDTDRARETARAAEAAVMAGTPLGPLHGLPVGIKDLEETKGLRTTWGSPLFADHVPVRDEAMVANLRAAGAIVLGKTNTPEFGAGANTRNLVYGATGNAFDPRKSAAGSSGGSAVALATGMVPIASGSDTGGSLRNPAAFNGIVGFRPSPGLVPSERRGLGWSNLPVLGPMARTAEDCALLLSAMADDDALDPLAYTLPGRRCGRATRRSSPRCGWTSAACGSRRLPISASRRPSGTSGRSSPTCRRTHPAFRPRRGGDARLPRHRRGLRGAARRLLPQRASREGAEAARGCRAQRPSQCRGGACATAWPTTPARRGSRRGSTASGSASSATTT